ncbi:MAG: hypothetical protein J6W98_01295 [Bacteroidales bacterium]|nr:hypothetical protein [Bacteroidales bacterium]
MKRIYSVIAIAFGLVSLASCELNSDPKFNDSDAFVAFDKTALSCSETDGEISVPVTLASLNGKSATISYAAANGTAKEGVNFDLVDASGTLTFTPENRTQYIKVKIYDPDVTFDKDGARVSGKYTGDLKFNLEFKGTGDVAASMESACTVTIKDLDHPLTNILGNWQFSAMCRGEMASWPCELKKDEEDDHVVWFYDLVFFSRSGWDGWDVSYYGVVSEDLQTITIPLGQESEYKYSNGEHITLYTVDSEFDEIYDSGSVTATIKYNEAGNAVGLVFDLDNTAAGEGAGLFAYIPGAGTINHVFAPFTAEKL